MSKSKMKNKVASAQQKNPPQEDKTKKKSQQRDKAKKKWTSPKEFNFLPPVKFLPGFRTAKHWKRIVAVTYFAFTPASLLLKFMDFRYFGVFIFVMLVTLPFLICSLITFFKTKDKYYAIEALIAGTVFWIDNLVLTNIVRNLIEAASGIS